MSTRAAVSTKLAQTIQGVGAAALGFASAVNVREYLPEHTGSEDWDPYFYAALAGGEQGIRVWAVDVTARPVVNRLPEFGGFGVEVTARVVAWYDAETQGAGKQLLDAHMSLVQQAIADLGITLGGTVLRLLDWTRATYEIETAVYAAVAGDEGDMLRGEFTIVADNPNGTI